MHVVVELIVGVIKMMDSPYFRIRTIWGDLIWDTESKCGLGKWWFCEILTQYSFFSLVLCICITFQITFIMCVCMWVCVQLSGISFLLSLCVWGIKFRSAGLTTGSFTHWAISLAHLLFSSLEIYPNPFKTMTSSSTKRFCLKGLK